MPSQEYVRRVDSLIHTLESYFTSTELAEARDFVARGTPWQGLYSLAWVIEQRGVSVPLEAKRRIAHLMSGLVDRERLPESFRVFLPVCKQCGAAIITGVLREDDGPTPEYCSFCDPDRPPSDWDRLAGVPSTYRKLFIAAKEFLQLQGMKPVLWNKKEVWEADLELIDRRTDHPMPAALRRFFIEMGDAFMFTPNDVPGSSLDGWSPIHLDDYAIYNKDFRTQIEEEASEEIASTRPRVDPKILRAEAEKRKLWIPFYGFVGSGDVLCLDAEGKVRFYEALYWRSAPETWDFVLAGSFDDFVIKWSGYSFVEPKVCWPTFCTGRSGAFDWSPQNFPPGVDRRNLERGNEKQA